MRKGIRVLQRADETGTEASIGPDLPVMVPSASSGELCELYAGVA